VIFPDVTFSGGDRFDRDAFIGRDAYIAESRKNQPFSTFLGFPDWLPCVRGRGDVWIALFGTERIADDGHKCERAQRGH